MTRAVETAVAGGWEAARFRTLWEAGRLTLGSRVGIGGRTHVIRGLEPPASGTRCLYVEDAADGTPRRILIPGR